ncbi:MAG: hypothetical protein D6729_04840 [Deltaproteobacteria bacterium]|nr:MAG: hypothetical protein D6729_04840 [Deltaproteobacteria bacterium]
MRRGSESTTALRRGIALACLGVAGLGGVGLTGAGCGALPATVEDTLEYEFAVQGSLGGAATGRFPGAGAEIAKTLENAGVPQDRVERVRIVEATLTHLGPACSGQVGCDLAFVERLELFVESPAHPEARVAALDRPGATQRAPLVLEQAEITPYVTDESMTLRASLLPNPRPLQDVQLRLTVRYQVDVRI